MPSSYTSNYNLSQWERTDKVLMGDFNADNAKIDGALAALAESKADVSALNALSQTVAGQGTALTKLGNCRIQCITYVGTGTYGEENPTQIKFSKKPDFFIVMCQSNLFFMSKYLDLPLFLGKYEAVHYDLTLTNTNFTWEGNTATLRSSEAVLQLNSKSMKYAVIAFFSQDGK